MFTVLHALLGHIHQDKPDAPICSFFSGWPMYEGITMLRAPLFFALSLAVQSSGR